MCLNIYLFEVQEKMPQSGLLQSAAMSLYIMYLTWSAVSNSPYSACKPEINIIPNGDNSTTTTTTTGKIFINDLRL